MGGLRGKKAKRSWTLKWNIYNSWRVLCAMHLFCTRTMSRAIACTSWLQLHEEQQQ